MRLNLFRVTLLTALLVGILATPGSVSKGSSHFRPLLRLGRGHINGAERHPSGKLLVVNTPLGAWFYDDKLQDIAHLENVRLARFSPAGKLIAASQSGKLTLLDSVSFRLIKDLGHGPDELHDLIWSPDGIKLAAIWKTGQVVIWETTTFRKLLSFQQPKTTVNAVFWSPNSEKLAMFDETQTRVVVWEVADGKVQTEFDVAAKSKFNARGGWLVWCPDNRRILRTTGVDELRLFQAWDTQTGELLFETENNGALMAFSPDGRAVALSVQFQGGYIADPVTFQTRLKLDLAGFLFLRWSPNGNLLAAGGSGFPANENGLVQILDPATGKTLHTLTSHSSVQTLEWSPNGTKLLTVNGDYIVRIVDVRTGQTYHERSDHSMITGTVEWSSDADKIAVADSTGTVRIWDLKPGNQTQVFTGHADAILMAWQPGGKYLAVASYVNSHFIGSGKNANVRIWDTTTGQLVTLLRLSDESTITSLSWDKKGSRLIVTSWNGLARIWDETSTTVIDAHKELGIYAIIWSAMFSPDGSRLLLLVDACCAGAWPSVWDVAKGKMIGLIFGSGDGTVIRDSRAYAWSPSSDKLYMTHWSGQTDPCGDGGCGDLNKIPGRTNVYIRVIFDTEENLDKKAPDLILQGHTARISSVAWNADTTRIATTSDDKTLRIWDAATGQLLHVLNSVDFGMWSPNGRSIAVWIGNQPTRIWDVITGQILNVPGIRSGFVFWSPAGYKLAQSISGVLTIWEQ
jgi:WD40 repeat protein